MAETAPAFFAFTTSVWLPEELALFELDSVTLEKQVIAYGSPQVIAAAAEQAPRHRKAWGGHFLKPDKISLRHRHPHHRAGWMKLTALS